MRGLAVPLPDANQGMRWPTEVRPFVRWIRHRSPLATQRVRYEVRLQNGDPYSIFPMTAYQSVERVDDNLSIITVTRVDPTSKLRSHGDTPSDAETSPSAMIQSDAKIISELAGRIPDVGEPWELALLIEKFVHDFVTEKNFSTAFATAADVARERAGDCTEHAVLVAALCRARQMPARVVVGLVYVPNLQGFAFHMWNEVWIHDHWVPMDATTAAGGVGAARIVVSRTALAAEESFASFLPVVQLIGQLELKILDVE